MIHMSDKTHTDKPPLFHHWSHWYLLVVGWLAVLILLFYWFTIYFS